MKKLIAGVVLGVGLTAMAHGAGDPQAGEQNAAACQACHGQGGAKPIMGLYPKIAGLGEKYLHNQLVAIQQGQRVIVQMTGQLTGKSDQDLQDLAAYFGNQDRSVNRLIRIWLLKVRPCIAAVIWHRVFHPVPVVTTRKGMATRLVVTRHWVARTRNTWPSSCTPTKTVLVPTAITQRS